MIRVRSSFKNLFRGRGRAEVEAALPAFLLRRRWYGGKARELRQVQIMEAIPLPLGRRPGFIVLASVSYAAGPPETYALALGFAVGREATRLLQRNGDRVLVPLQVRDASGALYEAFADPAFGRTLLEIVGHGRSLRGLHGWLVGAPGKAFSRLRGRGRLDPSPVGAEQSNSSLFFGDRLILKLFRRIEAGENLDLEIGRFLTEVAGYPHSPAVAGSLMYRPLRGRRASLAIVQQCVANQGDAWRYTLDDVGRYFQRVLALPAAERVPPPQPATSLLRLARREVPRQAVQAIGGYLEDARLLGQRTGELHLALAGDEKDPAFSPEAFSASYRTSLHESLCTSTETTFGLLARRLEALPEEVRAQAAALLPLRDELLKCFQVVLDAETTALRIRVHGDYHLGQVLRSGSDWVIIDFEGEPAVPLAARRVKRCPLRDAAGMVRSFHYAAHHGLVSLLARGSVSPEERAWLLPWVDHWFGWVAAAFLRGYLESTAGAAFLPRDERQLEALFTVYLLEKAIYELGYELNNRPEWVLLPVAGIRELLEVSR
jgi:trehalose synthase-fused probable maltokinase